MPDGSENRVGARSGVRFAAWTVVAIAMFVPVALAAASPYLAYRGPAYIIGGFAGIVCLSLLLIQPLLATGYLPGPGGVRARRWHRRVGTSIVLCAVMHVAGLFITSPPDALDALLLVSPTPFSVYGVIALWGIIGTGVLVAFRRRSGLRYRDWRLVHNALALVVVLATVIHAVQIEGAMEPASKYALAIAVIAATVATLLDQRILGPLLRRGRRAPSRDFDD